MRLLINLKIPKNIICEMDIYRKEYNPSKLSHLHSHITLVPPFILKGEMSNLVDDVRHCLHATRSFPVQINGIGSFGDKVLFFKPTCPRELNKLHVRLKRLIQEKYRRQTRYGYWKFSMYHPHATIAIDSARHIRQYRRDLKAISYKRQFVVNGVDLYAQRKDKCWVFKREFVFEKS